MRESIYCLVTNQIIGITEISYKNRSISTIEVATSGIISEYGYAEEIVSYL